MTRRPWQGGGNDVRIRDVARIAERKSIVTVSPGSTAPLAGVMLSDLRLAPAPTMLTKAWRQAWKPSCVVSQIGISLRPIDAGRAVEGARDAAPGNNGHGCYAADRNAAHTPNRRPPPMVNVPWDTLVLTTVRLATNDWLTTTDVAGFGPRLVTVTV